MKLFTAPDFNRSGSAQLPGGDWAACGIAPSSEVDLCVIGGQRLGPMSLLPISGSVKADATRGYVDALGGSLSLLLYEKCDLLVPPGPRAAIRTYGWMRSTDLQATAATATRVLRLPFAGRRQAAFHFRRVGATDLNIVIRGIRYVPRDLLTRKVSEGSIAVVPFIDEITDTWWGGAGAAPTSVTNGATELLGRTIYVGGVDNQESYDEFEVWLWGAAGIDVLYCEAEAFGEHVL